MSKSLLTRKKYKNIPAASSVYNNLYLTPSISKILNSKLSFKKKCLLIEKIEILHNMKPGTEEYFTMKHQIDSILKMQTGSLVLRLKSMDLSKHNRVIIMKKIDQLEQMNANSDEYDNLINWIQCAICISNRTITICTTPPIINSSSKYESYLSQVKHYMDSKIYGMDQAKEKLLELTAMQLTKNNLSNASFILQGAPGVGKCLHPNTQILMYLGGMKAAKDIIRGDILMGDDSQPRIVISTNTGRDCMYKITPEYSEPFIVNEPHVITLYNEFTEHTSDIPLNEYLKKSESWKSKHKMFCVPVEYAKVPTKNDPYLVGILLNSKSNTVDEVVKEYLTSRLDNLASYVSGVSDIRTLNLSTIDKNEIAYLLNHRYIPDTYLYNNRENRYKLLRGFIEVTRERKPVEQQRSRSLERTPNSAGSRTSSTGSRSRTPVKRSSTPKPTRTSILRSSNIHRSRLVGSIRQSSSGKQLSNTPDSSRDTPNSAHNRSSSRDAHKSSKLSGKPTSRPRSLSRDKAPIKPGLAKFIEKTIPKVENKTNKKKLTVETRKSPGHISEPSDSDGSPLSRGTIERQTRLKQFKERMPVINGKDTKLTIKDKLLGEQIKFLARSLGFKTMYISDEIWICDDIDILPPVTRKIETSFHVTQLVTSEYCGFTLDGNGRFILSSFLVTHNTHLANVYADAIKIPFSRIDVKDCTEDDFIGKNQLDDASPGLICKAITKLKDVNNKHCRSGVVFIDNFDKTESDATLFRYLNDVYFYDRYLPGIQINLSDLIFVYSIDDPECIDTNTLNKLHLIKLQGYSRLEKKHILANFVLPKLLQSVNLDSNIISFTDDALDVIMDIFKYDTDKGLHKYNQVINSIISKINALTHAPKGMFSYSIPNIELPIRITPSILETFKSLFDTSISETHLSIYL